MDRFCPHCNSDNIVKYGVRVNKTGANSQRYFCNSCKKEFSIRDERGWDKEIRRAIVTPVKHFTYEDKPAINALLKAIDLVKPSIYVDLGDTGEWESVSQWKWKR